jgi:hypothetical protein
MRRVLIAGAVLATLLVGGCGIPENGDVTVVRPGPAGGVPVSDTGVTPTQYTRTSTNDPQQFVEYYLQAAAGDPDTALARIKAFMTPEEAAGFTVGAGTDVKVVRMVEQPLTTPGNPEITINVQQVGTLNANGVLTPPGQPTPAPTPYHIKVDTQAGKNGLFVLDAPPMLMITDDALNAFYEPRAIYWWDLENTGLVPDVRYMPRSVATALQPTTVLGWLANGPADWLRNQVHALPQGTTANGNVPAIANDTLQIKLDAPAIPPGDAGQLDRLRRQLQWSLRPLVPHTLELTIGRQDPVKYADSAYLESNIASRLSDLPERFVIFNGVIRRLVGAAHATEPVPVLKAAANKNLTAAAMSSSSTHTFAAVLTGTGRNERLRVAAAATGTQADLKTVGGLSGTLGRPVWARAPDGDPRGALGLITANGRLYSFRADGSSARRVEWQGDPGPVTAVSVAPDGHRVAAVAGGNLYRTVLSVSADGASLSAPEQLLPPTLARVAAVAWSSEIYLAVAGVRPDGRYSVLDVTTDGALEVPNSGLSDIGTVAVTYLTAYPANPVESSRNLGDEIYETSGGAWDVVGSPPERITAGEVAGSTAGQPATPPTAPFFMG